MNITKDHAYYAVLGILEALHYTLLRVANS